MTGCQHGPKQYLERCEVHQIEDLKARLSEAERKLERARQALEFYNLLPYFVFTPPGGRKLAFGPSEAREALAEIEKG